LTSRHICVLILARLRNTDIRVSKSQGKRFEYRDKPSLAGKRRHRERLAIGLNKGENQVRRHHLKTAIKSSLAISATPFACVAPNATTLNSQEER
jgi:hypothetical protein